MAIEQLFFELIRVAIGTQDTLSRPPSAEEWRLLYDMAKKQSLVGVCFAGVQRLLGDSSETSETSQTPWNLPEMDYLRWMGMAAKIQQRNEVLNRQCDELRKMLDADGFASVILKGQGVAKLYGSLAGLRQSGDIDVWMCPKDGLNLSHTDCAIKVISYLKSKVECGHTTYHNTSWNIFTDTEVEAHYTPSWLYSPVKNRRLQRWFESVAESEMKREFSSVEFNTVYVLQHIYRHLFGEGIGLRQVVDYYFVLLAANEEGLSGSNGSRGSKSNLSNISNNSVGERSRTTNSSELLQSLGLMKFAGALMYILESHLGLEEKYLLCPADPEEGCFLLNEIMQAGNFGHYDERISRERKGLLGGFWMHVKRNMHFVTHYPSEVLWCPLWKVWHQLWLRRMNINK